MRLDLALIALHPSLSRRKAREVIEKGQVTVDGVTVTDAGRAVGPGAALAWDANKKARPRARLSLPILHQDDAVLIVDKPAGLLAVPTGPEAEHEDTALRRVQEFVRHLSPRHPYAGVVHRLDRDTSGALAFVTYPRAPAWSARDANIASSCMLKISTLACGSRAITRRVASTPLMPGRLMSITTTSGATSQNSR